MQIDLDEYERDNLLSTLIAISGIRGTSPLNACHTGDWVMELAWKLGYNPIDQTTLGNPNVSVEEMMRRSQPDHPWRST